VDVAAHILWVLPVSFLCMQYGLDMIMEAVVPMSKKQIARRIAAGQW
jgi:hypothetical protein